MTQDSPSDYLLRDAVLGLLSADEVARVTSAGEAVRLAEGEEYLDLEHLEQGVQRSIAACPRVGGLLARADVSSTTWAAVLALLANHRAAPPPALA